jgi:hypothetical protein
MPIRWLGTGVQELIKTDNTRNNTILFRFILASIKLNQPLSSIDTFFISAIISYLVFLEISLHSLIIHRYTKMTSPIIRIRDRKLANPQYP